MGAGASKPYVPQITSYGSPASADVKATDPLKVISYAAARPDQNLYQNGARGMYTLSNNKQYTREQLEAAGAVFGRLTTSSGGEGEKLGPRIYGEIDATKLPGYEAPKEETKEPVTKPQDRVVNNDLGKKKPLPAGGETVQDVVSAQTPAGPRRRRPTLVGNNPDLFGGFNSGTKQLFGQ